MDQISKTKPLIAVALGVFILFVVALLPKKSDSVTYTADTVSSQPATKETTTDTSVTAAASAASSATIPTSPYKDGTYTATGSYESPAGTEDIQVTLTLKDGIIESSNVVSEAQDGESSRYQSRFIAGYTQYVAGKSIDSVNLSKVSGSSLTPQGWNDAVAKIKAEATA